MPSQHQQRLPTQSQPYRATRTYETELKPLLKAAVAVLNNFESGMDDKRVALSSLFSSSDTEGNDGAGQISGLIEGVLDLVGDGYAFTLLNVRKNGENTVFFILRADRFDNEVIGRYVATVHRGRITHVEKISQSLKRKVAGQVSASLVTTHQCFPTESEISSHVRELPMVVNDNLMAPESGMAPVKEVHEVVKVVLQASEDNVDIKTSHGEPYAGGAQLVRIRNVVLRSGGRLEFVLQDKDGNIVAGISRRVRLRWTASDIYALKPIKPNDKPVFSFGGHEFYPWFRVEEQRFVNTRQIDAWDGLKYQPFMLAFSTRERHTLPRLASMLRIGQEVILFLDAGTGLAYGLLDTHDDPLLGIEVTAAPGVDPAMLLCFATSITSHN